MCIFTTSNVGAAKTNYLYNNNGELIETTNMDGTVQYEYDANDNKIHKYISNNVLRNSGFEVYNGMEGLADGWAGYKAEGVNGSYEVTTTSVSEGKRHKDSCIGYA